LLRGLNELTLDAKGRLAIPTRYRQELTDSCGGQLVVTVDRDHCLLVYPFPEWEIVEKKIVDQIESIMGVSIHIEPCDSKLGCNPF